jgi:hypothetical protein
VQNWTSREVGENEIFTENGKYSPHGVVSVKCIDYEECASAKRHMCGGECRVTRAGYECNAENWKALWQGQ